MNELVAYSSLCITLTLIVSRPRLGSRVRLESWGAVAIGAAILIVSGLVGSREFLQAATVLWSPLLVIASLIVLAATASELGLIQSLARRLEARVHGSAIRLLLGTFALAAILSAVLSNDDTILLLSPVVITLVRRRYPGQPALLLPFAYAVFAAAGVAPLLISNPMNTIFASAAGIGFNAYAAVMTPVALAGTSATLLVLWLGCRSKLRDAREDPVAIPPAAGLDRPQRILGAIIVAMLVLQPIASALSAPIWPVTALAAAAALAVVACEHGSAPGRILLRSAAPRIAAFLLGVFLIAQGLRRAGAADRLAAIYDTAHPALVGLLSSVGSALINNHPMALLNLLAIDHQRPAAMFAAMIGGNLGPRLLPMGSIAGLLWVELLRRERVEISVGRFALIGLALTAPALLASLGVLWLIS